MIDYKFKDIKFEKSGVGEQGFVNTPNGYEVSIVRNGCSYGGKKGLYEIGIYHKDHQHGMVIPEGWTDSVKGWLTPQLVCEELHMLANSPVKFDKVRA